MIKIEVSSDIEVSTRRKIKKSSHKYSSDSDSTKKQSEKHADKKKKLEAEKEAEPESTSRCENYDIHNFSKLLASSFYFQIICEYTFLRFYFHSQT